MAESESLDRRALEILSETVAEQLGRSNQVVQDVLRASSSGSTDDLAKAQSAFDSLPVWRRNEIGFAARDRARAAARVRIDAVPDRARVDQYHDPDVPEDAALPRFLLGPRE